jgi:hypothetical protein
MNWRWLGFGRRKEPREAQEKKERMRRRMLELV